MCETGLQRRIGEAVDNGGRRIMPGDHFQEDPGGISLIAVGANRRRAWDDGLEQVADGCQLPTES